MVPKWTLLSDAKRVELQSVALKGFCNYCHTYLWTLADLAKHNVVVPPAVNQWGTCHVLVETQAVTDEDLLAWERRAKGRTTDA